MTTEVEKVNETGSDNHGFEKDTLHATSSKKASLTVIEEKSGKDEKKNSYEMTEDDDKVDISCGIWRFRTNIFGRKFANLYVFSICMGLSSFFAMMVSSVIHIQLQSIQRQFNINTAQAGMFDTASRIGSVCTILFAGHFAKKVHIPMAVGVAGVIQGIILMTPGFMQFAHPYTLEQVQEENLAPNSTDFKVNGKYLCRESAFFTQNGSLSNYTPTAAPAINNYNFQHIGYIILVVVQALKGVTDSFHSGFLPALYMDDNMMDKTKMGIFSVGLNSILTELATPIGREINGILTDTPVDLKHNLMGAKDERFVAAWWLAFLLFGAGTVLFSIPLMLFPRKLVSKRQQEEALKKAVISFTAGNIFDENQETDENKDSQTEKDATVESKGINSSRPTSLYGKNTLAPRISVQSGSSVTMGYLSRKRSSLLPPVLGPTERRVSIDGTMVFEQPIRQRQPKDNGESIQGSSNFKDLVKDFPKAFIRLFRRPVFVLIIIDIIIGSIPYAGTAIFRSSYIKYEYNVSMSEVALLTGVTSAVGQVVGTIISGFLANRVKTKMGYNYIIVGTYIISMLITPLYIVFGCDNQYVYGHQGDYGLQANRSDACGCQESNLVYLACGNDTNNYLSPCYAGCQNVYGQVFSNCSGIQSSAITNSVTLTPGICDSNCRTNFLLYVCLQAGQMLLFSMGSIPRRLLILRIVDPKDRGFATSVFAFCSIVISIPSPNLFGKIIDGTCLIKNGHVCALYDRDKIRYFLSGMDVGVNLAIQITMFFILYFFKKEENEMKQKLKEEAEEKSKVTEMTIN